ncbi:1,2-phenylacetyl-CoA epoxidase subunit PaaC [Marinomonas algarum]|uniref:Phenylacetate-CoA oxygenase subunit PaaC n=1 Tax=Marinomonas algarum TaxID=2883105 RepID=A0A9X1IJF7_9GAMM|nr:1,2-phenylacetyl-CoA epoxidase subunit PaaC [Marinomonas algarum]MCB5160395.1 phenylacetate-CoA oxygenase subunit PaaC [Marinomonas algarum]
MQKYDDLTEFVLRMGDSALIQAQRLCEWTGKAPALEEELALMNVGLDLVGQARNWLDYAAELIGDGTDADALAYRRDERNYRNVLMVEQPNGDFAVTMLKQFLYDVWQFHMLSKLRESKDDRVAAIATKSLKEVTYHLRRSSDWIKRLGDGTEESHQRMVKAIDDVWRFTYDFLQLTEQENALIDSQVIGDVRDVAAQWQTKVNAVFVASTLTVPKPAEPFYLNSREGVHSECLGALLAEMQYLQRAHPNASW